MPRRAVCVCVCFFLFCLFYGGGGGGLGGTPQGWAIRALCFGRCSQPALKAGTHTRGGGTAPWPEPWGQRISCTHCGAGVFVWEKSPCQGHGVSYQHVCSAKTTGRNTPACSVTG